MSAMRCAAVPSSSIPEPVGQAAMTTDSPPVTDFHSTSVTKGITGCSNRSSVSNTVASTTRVLSARSTICTLANSRYQSQNSSHAK
ncbi:Uncharacterised protein [Mycobacteroides abscessus subsp. abscessus]|nr:Uncharacterised protein [Mycobacteroides abscessus subsp. abscessus]